MSDSTASMPGADPILSIEGLMVGTTEPVS